MIKSKILSSGASQGVYCTALKKAFLCERNNKGTADKQTFDDHPVLLLRV